jgi:hypothetical protein
MPGEFECSREVILRADPDEVWEAIATTTGNAAWLFPNELGPDSAAVWDPPHRLAVRQEQGDWFNALEYTIEGRGDGTTRMRYVHSGIFVEDWDSQYDAVSQHTDFYLHTLSQYLEHFTGRAATYIGDVPQGIAGPPSSATPEGFSRLKQALGLDEPLTEGGEVHLGGPYPVAGTLDYVRPNFFGVRTADELYCFFGRNAFGAPVGISIHSFAAGVDAEQVKQAWHDWLGAALR